MADQNHSTPQMAEEAPLLYEMEPLKPVPTLITELPSSIGVKRDEASPWPQDASGISRFGRLAFLSLWIPKLDPGNSLAQLSRPWWSERRNMLLIQQALAIAVFIINLSWSIWAITHYNTTDRVSTMYRGDCRTVKTLNLWLHLAINALSTLLLGSSNYCMQLLVAPTPSEVQRAHERSKWLDIGIPSFRNLWWIARRSWIVWSCLWLSSAFLHLFWNSAIFSSIPAYSYTAAFTTQDYQQHNDSWGWSGNVDLDRIKLNLSSFERLSNSQCIERYVNSLNYGKDVVVVTNKSSSANDNKAFLGSMDLNSWPYQGLWICASPDLGSRKSAVVGGCTPDFVKPFGHNWTVVYQGEPRYNASINRESVPVLYCLSAGVHNKDDGCGLHFSIPIIVLVCGLNFMKCVCIVWSAWYNKSVKPFTTTGDAIAFYLRNPDPRTKGMSIASCQEFRRKRPWFSGPRVWSPKRVRWFRAASGRRWIFVLTLCFITLAIVSWLLEEAIAERKRDLAPRGLVSLWKQGLEEVNDHEVIGRGFDGSITEVFLQTVLLANSPQLLFSFLYYLYNGLLTCMLAAEEQSRFGFTRKALRVSVPEGYQRSSWFLSLPYKYSIPLMVCSGLLHWLISQSLFLVRIVMYDENNVDIAIASRAGFSPIGIILSFSLGCILVIALVVIGFLRQYPGGERALPLLSTCSAAISAACHAPEDDQDAHLLPVRWGVVSSDEDSIGHCSFTTAMDVRPPLEGALYS